jgi:hypothetical protein
MLFEENDGRRLRSTPLFSRNGLRRCSLHCAFTTLLHGRVEIHSERAALSAQHRGGRHSNDLLIFDGVLTTIPLKWTCGLYC